MDLISGILGNQFATGGLLLGLLGYVAYALKAVPETIYHYINRKIFVNCEVSNRDDCYSWVNNWFSHNKFEDRSNELMVMSSVSSFTINGNYINEPIACGRGSDGTTKRRKIPKIYFVPGTGRHFVTYKGKFVFVNKTSQKVDGGGQRRDAYTPEFFTFTVFVWNKQIIKDLISEIRDVAHPPDDSVKIYIADYSQWRKLAAIEGRSIDSVVLHNNLQDEIVEDINWFVNNKSWYRDREIPWRRGYLFHGQPGNGKSSMIRAIATKLGMNIAILKLTEGVMEDANLYALLSSVDESTIIVIEDIDCIFEGRDKKESSIKINFSTFLNAIDGVSSSEGRIIIMTTNHIEKLDAALIRPGRIDKKYYFDNSDYDMALKLARRFISEEESVKFAEENKGKSMSELQVILLGMGGK